jgi:hypothetical protein
LEIRTRIEVRLFFFFLNTVNGIYSFLGSSSPTSANGAIGLLDNGSGNRSNSPNGGIKEEIGGGDVESGGVIKANKGMILRKSVDYIR